MGIEDLAGQAKSMLGGHEDQAKDALDKAGEAVKAKTDDGQDGIVDSVVDKAKSFLDDQK
jgi:hypothetical protein